MYIASTTLTLIEFEQENRLAFRTSAITAALIRGEFIELLGLKQIGRWLPSSISLRCFRRSRLAWETSEATCSINMYDVACAEPLLPANQYHGTTHCNTPYKVSCPGCVNVYPWSETEMAICQCTTDHANNQNTKPTFKQSTAQVGGRSINVGRRERGNA